MTPMCQFPLHSAKVENASGPCSPTATTASPSLARRSIHAAGWSSSNSPSTTTGGLGDEPAFRGLDDPDVATSADVQRPPGQPGVLNRVPGLEQAGLEGPPGGGHVVHLRPRVDPWFSHSDRLVNRPIRGGMLGSSVSRAHTFSTSTPITA